MLPQYFAIRRKEGPLWKEYIEWVNTSNLLKWKGTDWRYYGKGKKKRNMMGISLRIQFQKE